MDVIRWMQGTRRATKRKARGCEADVFKGTLAHWHVEDLLRLFLAQFPRNKGLAGGKAASAILHATPGPVKNSFYDRSRFTGEPRAYRFV
jgi:hypothetical protein